MSTCISRCDLNKYFLGAAALLGGGAVCFASYRILWPKLKKAITDKKADKSENIYESEKLLNEYLTFHYGGPTVNCLHSFGAVDGFEFPTRCAELCLKHYHPSEGVPNRALDIGCAVGRSSFELAQTFTKVIGIDFSYGFTRTCDALKKNGEMEYEALVEGHLTTKHTAVVPSVDRERCEFRQGDACNLPLDLGQFGCVLAANLICRLPDPMAFLLRLSNLVAPGGICVITSPYSFLEEYTSKKKWLGGYKEPSGNEVRAFETLKQILNTDFEFLADEDMPFLIRETARKHQWTVAHATVWKRKTSKE